VIIEYMDEISIVD